MKTQDVDSLTNSVLMQIEGVMRKNDLAPAFHRTSKGNRKIIRGMIAAMVADGIHELDQQEG